ncbi:MAG: flagellar motor protein MotB [Nitrospiria bacterium]
MAKKKPEPERDPAAGLLVMMVSLNLILLIFFIFLNSIGANDEERVKKALGSLAGRFGILRGGVHLMPGKKILLPGSPLVSPEMNNVSLAREVRNIIEEGELKSDLRIIEDGHKLVIDMNDQFLFHSGSADLRIEAGPVLAEISTILKKFKYPIRIEGHTDDLAIATEQYPSNWELSAARATSVMRNFIEKQNLPAGQLSAVGYGAYRPLVKNDSALNRSRNRRVNIVVVKGNG